MAWFNFIKNKRRKNLAEKGISEEIVRVLGENNPEMLHSIITLLSGGGGSKQLSMNQEVEVGEPERVKDIPKENIEDAVKVEKNDEVITESNDVVGDETTSSVESSEEMESSVNVNYEFKSGGNQQVPFKNKVKDTIRVEIPDGNGKHTEVFVWDEKEEKDFDPSGMEMLKKTSTTVGKSPMDNPRVVVIGAKSEQSPEVLAYYEVLKSLGKFLVDESEVTVLKKYDAFYFAGLNNSEEVSEKQMELAQNAKNLYVVYFDGKVNSKLPFKRSFTMIVPFKAVDRYDSLNSRVEFLIDYTNIEIKDKKQIKSVVYVNTLSLLNNHVQLLKTKTIRAKKPPVIPLTEYVYVNNYHKNISFPLNKVSKNLDITVYGQSNPEIVALAVTFSGAIDYYSAPVYIEKYDKVLHFVETEDVNLQKADPALLTYAEAGVPMAIVAPNSPNKEEYLELINPENDDKKLTKDELFRRFGNGTLQLKNALS